MQLIPACDLRCRLSRHGSLAVEESWDSRPLHSECAEGVSDELSMSVFTFGFLMLFARIRPSGMAIPRRHVSPPGLKLELTAATSESGLAHLWRRKPGKKGSGRYPGDPNELLGN
jgi:hypothetical protein